MQPNQPYNPIPPTTPPPEQNPYDFIMNSGNDQKKSGAFNLPSGNSTLQRVLIFAGGLFILVVSGFILLALLGGGRSNTTSLLELAQEQTELVRIADQVSKEPSVRNESTRILAVNTSLSVNSTTQQVITMITKSGSKAEPKKLALLKNPKSDALLQGAKQNNQYDETAMQLLQTGLKNYRTKLKATYDAVSNESDKKVLSEAYRGVGLLLGDKQSTTAN